MLTITSQIITGFRAIPMFWTAFLAFVRANAARSGAGWSVSMSNAPTLVRTVISRIAAVTGIATLTDIIIPNEFGPVLGLGGGDILNPTAPVGSNGAHPGQVVKQWTANGVPFVRLADGRMGAFSKKRGSWKYWKPKKPIVMYASGSSDLRTLLKADNASTRQLRRLKKAVDRRFPPPRRRRSSQTGTTIIQESGAGGVQRT